MENTSILPSNYSVLHLQCHLASVFSPAPIGHLMGTVEHAHQCLLVIDARERYNNGRVGGDQVQVVFGEVKVD